MRVASAASAAKTIAMIVAGMDCGRVNINAGDRTAFELPGGRRSQGERETRRSRPIKPGRKTLGGDFSILRIEKCAEDDDLAGEFAMEKIRVVAFNAGVQIGERKRLNIVAATLEIESQCVWHRTRNEIAASVTLPSSPTFGSALSERDASSSAIEGTRFPSAGNVSGTLRTTSSGSEYMLSGRIFFC